MRVGQLFTIGHSNRDLASFVSLLLDSNIQCLVDIRAYPNSRRYPHFSQNNFRDSLVNRGIRYLWSGKQLGGMRKPGRNNRHSALHNQSMQGFAEHMEQKAFWITIQQLMKQSAEMPTVLCCAEKNPMQCHRSLICDFLVVRQIKVLHIIDADTIHSHSLSELARIESQKLVYDRNTNQDLDLR